VRAAGGTTFYSNSAMNAGVSLAPGAGSWANLSDVHMKTNFRDLDGETVLTKLAGIPVREWNYITQDASIRHVGPTAQDFHAAFGLGDNDRTINTLDPDGISLKAIQALYTRSERLQEQSIRLQEQSTRLQEQTTRLEEENAALKAEVSTMHDERAAMRDEVARLRAAIDALQRR